MLLQAIDAGSHFWEPLEYFSRNRWMSITGEICLSSTDSMNRVVQVVYHFYFINKELKKVGLWCFWCFCHTAYLADVTDAGCCTQHGSTHCHVFAIVKHRFLTNWIRNGTNLLCIFFIPLLLVGPVIFFVFGCPLTLLWLWCPCLLTKWG